MPDPSVGSLEAIEKRLHANATRPDDRSITRFDPFVRLPDAVAAVRDARAATVQAIVEALAHDHTDLDTALAGHRHIANERERCSRWVARRFASPTGDTE